MKTINQLFEESVNKYTGNTYILEKTTGDYEAYTFADIRKEVHRFAAGLMSIGVKKGDRIALLADGRKDWVVAELGILYTGAVNVPLSVKLAEPAELKFRLEHSGSRMIIISAVQAAKLSEFKHQMQGLERIIYMEAPGLLDEKEVLMEDICKAGDDFLAEHPEEFTRTWQGVQGDDYANICYTSGTTADPKGIILTHRNYTANVEQARSIMPVPEWYTTLLIIPWDHSFAHTTGIFTIMSAGASLAAVQTGKSYIESLKNIPGNIKEIRPVFLQSVPSLAKNFKKNIEKGIREKGKTIERLFNHAMKIAISYNGNGFDRGKGMKAFLKPLYWLYDKILFKKVRENLGGRMRFFVGGGALLDIDLQRFYYAIGIPMFQGYGLTEASPVISGNSEERHKLGTSGYLVTDLELRICDDDGNELPKDEKGEIVIRGENVMKGYWKNEKATAETIRDGWLHTGDLGYMDSDGFLYVLGRFKSLLISDDGEKFSPEGIEEAMTQHCSFIDQCMMYNNQKPYSVLLVVPNREAIKRWMREKELSVESDEGIRTALEELGRQLSQYRTGGVHQDLFPQRWLPAATALLPEGFTEENQLMNSTMKIVRNKITETYKESIEFLYTPEAKNLANSRNMEIIKNL